MKIELPKEHDVKFRRLSDHDIHQENHYDVLSKEIPKQLPKGEIQAILTAIQNKVASGSKIALMANFALNLIVTGSLNDIWSAINAQQLIILIPLCDVSIPASTLDFFK